MPSVWLVAVCAALLLAMVWRWRRNARVVHGGAVFVSGAGSGIGRAIVDALDRAGFLVIACVRQETHVKEIVQAHPRVRCVLADVTVEAEVKAAVAEVQRFVRIKNVPLVGVVNNAGVGFPAPLELSTADQAMDVFRVNVGGAIRVTNALLPMLLESKGRIVFVGSVSAKTPVPGLAIYAASKCALQSIAAGYRMELMRSDVRVSNVEPGFIHTPLHDKELATMVRSGALQHARYAELGRSWSNIYSATGSEKYSAPVSLVTADVLHALTARAPKRRYTPAGQMLALLFQVLPVWLAERMAVFVFWRPRLVALLFPPQQPLDAARSGAESGASAASGVPAGSSKH